MGTMPMFKRNLAFSDVETTGLDPIHHEIIEIGLVVARQDNLEILDTLDVKIRPEHPDRIAPDAVERNGYNEKEWEGAGDLHHALALYSEKTKDAIFCAYNATFDWPFMLEAFRKTGITDTMDYHRIDVFTLAWAKLHTQNLSSMSLASVSEHLGLPPEPTPHRAMHGAHGAYEVYKKLATLE